MCAVLAIFFVFKIFQQFLHFFTFVPVAVHVALEVVTQVVFLWVHFLVFAKVVTGITVLKSINAHNTNVANFFIVISSFPF